MRARHGIAELARGLLRDSAENETLDSGYYAACAGLRAQTQALEIIANNVANVSTGGYRGQQPLFRSLLASSYGDMADPLNRAVNDFAVLGGSRIDLRAGNLERTGNALDMAIEGNGFFAIQRQGGNVYTRAGNFQVSPDGRLTTVSGDAVLGETGPITLPQGEIAIGPDGTLSVNGALAGKLRVVQFAPGSAPEAVGASYYALPDSAIQPAVGASVRQGMLESSNVSPMTAVVDLLMVERRAEMLERALTAFHSNLDHIAANDLPHV